MKNFGLLKMKETKSGVGFILPLAVLITSIILSLSFTIFIIVFHSIKFSALGRDSQVAFYAADGGAECALFWDVKMNAFDPASPLTTIDCAEKINVPITENPAGVFSFSLADFQNGSCVDVEVDKSNSPNTIIRSKGHNICGTGRTDKVERALEVTYKDFREAGGPSPNNPPVANDDNYVTNYETQLVVSAPGVLFNDTDGDSDPLTSIKLTDPLNGTLNSFNPDGSFTYTPDNGFSGSDSFTYKANDGTDDSNTATVNIVVNPESLPDNPPVANATISTDGSTYSDIITVTQGVPTNIYFSASGSSDPDGWADPINGVSSCDWNWDLDTSPSYEVPVSNPADVAACSNFAQNGGLKTFNDIPGIYTYSILRISDQPGASDTDTVQVVIEAVSSGVLDVAVSASSDDAEEHQDGGMEGFDSSDLELVEESDIQIVGMRFQNITIPQGASITNAYIQFTVDETGSTATNLTFYAQDADDTSTFTDLDNSISSRPKTSASVNWNNIPAWPTTGEAGPNQRTPDLSAIIQEVVSRSGWISGNSVAIIVTGSGKRTAEAYDGTAAPSLHVEYSY